MSQANQKTESLKFVHRWLRTPAMFNVLCFPVFVHHWTPLWAFWQYVNKHIHKALDMASNAQTKANYFKCYMCVSIALHKRFSCPLGCNDVGRYGVTDFIIQLTYVLFLMLVNQLSPQPQGRDHMSPVTPGSQMLLQQHWVHTWDCINSHVFPALTSASKDGHHHWAQFSFIK